MERPQPLSSVCVDVMIGRVNHSAARARRRALALALAAIAAGVSAFVLPAVAGAAPTAQASYYNLSWVPYIDPADLPPLEQRPVICVVDTGVGVTPDLPAAGVNSSLVARLDLSGGGGLPYSSDWPWNHGTSMSTFAIGADNGWGITGIFPQGRVLSVKASADPDHTINYPMGLKACRTYAEDHSLILAAGSLSLGSASESTSELLNDEILKAHILNYRVVAAAGNTVGPVLSPGNAPGVFTAAAGRVGGALCSYAADGPQVDVVGPSCGISDVDPFTGQTFSSNSGGSSMATVVTAAVMGLLRTMKPTASYSDVEQWILAGATDVGGKKLLNGDGAMIAAGLSDVLARAKARELNPPVDGGPSTPDQPTKPGDNKPTLRSPRARVSFSRRSLRVRVTNRPRNGKVVVKLIYRQGEFSSRSVKRSTKRSTLTLRSKKRPTYVDVRFLKGSVVSPTIRFRSRRGSWVQLKGASTD